MEEQKAKVADMGRRAEEMGRRAEEEHAVVMRLKREGDLPEVPATEVERRVGELKRHEGKASAVAPRGSTTGLFKAVCSTDLLFLIDTTASMSSYIEAAKKQVTSIVQDIRRVFLGDVEVRMAVVGYKDHGDYPNIQFLDFTPQPHLVCSFLDGLEATGGNDAPEDVLGGIRQALNATWMHPTKCIIHIADAPPHGRTLHDLSGPSVDYYDNPGSEPHGLMHGPLLSQMVKLQINYALLRINNTTDRMAFTFLQAYAAALADCTLLETNKYYSEALRLSPRRNSKGALLFQEAELGISYRALQHLVVKAVTASVSRSALRNADRMRRGRINKSPDLGPLAAIEEDDDTVPLEIARPQWDRHWLNETLEVDGFCPDGITAHGVNTLNDMMARDDKLTLSVLELTIHKRQMPFAQGALRVAFYACTAASTNRYVVKSFKRDGSKLADVAAEMRCQALCKSFSIEFNALLGDEHSIDFIVSACFKGKEGRASSDACISLEPFLEGTFVKYNSNFGYVNMDIPNDPSNQAAQAFSHFTFERSRGRFLVSDLQGVGKSMTDPVVHTLDPERFILSKTNLGVEGFKFFFATHTCNDICRKLGLRSNASMFISGRYEFREQWPSVAYTVCCSNKLCGRSLDPTIAKESAKFPGYRWCDVCWPQLELFTVKWLCVGPGPHHQFEESRFFYESQGRSTPRKCSEHREEDIRALDGRAVPSNRVFYESTTRSTPPTYSREMDIRARDERLSAVPNSFVYQSLTRSTLHTYSQHHEEDIRALNGRLGALPSSLDRVVYEPLRRSTLHTYSEHREEDIGSATASGRKDATKLKRRTVTTGRREKGAEGPSTGVVGRIWSKLKSRKKENV